VAEVIAEQGFTKAELAERLGKTKGWVTQVLGGYRNMTLRSRADVADAPGVRVRVVMEQRSSSRKRV
jgi:transcriptional regulator with XRE-family HTH domain